MKSKFSDDVKRKILKALEWTAIDVMRSARASIKSGGKTRTSKNWQTSKPGEPPRSHVGTLKQAIRYERDGEGYVVGAPKLGSSSALKALEHGGSSSIKATYYSEEYVANVKKKKRASAKAKRNGDVRVRPKTARPYIYYTKNNPRGVRVTEYQYFWSRDAWERARNATAFQTWARGVRQTETTSIRLAARPYMAPALAKEIVSTKTNARLARAFQR